MSITKNSKAKRFLATKNIRIYPTTLSVLQQLSYKSGKTIAHIVHELAERAE